MDRDIGPIGTTARIIGGVTAIAVPIALDGLGWWDVGVALVALTPAAVVAFWVWLGVSLLVAAAPGYGGCELLALSI